ncbi:peroxiredoxin [Mucilaginibacter sp. HMF5004]|uniref:peroxiredoxin n=1 Tax=Mucilaginibacter rivuli TaxID=2857527 RepID=UPI001C5E1B07|nr:peroxiredoxin [Mucilaginibacter rivuli]MBW4889255.1 peroxiredoxin [Mucilaginibacter rivuli]
MKKLLSVTTLSILFSISLFSQSKKPLAVGDAVPKFTLTDQDGKAFNVADEIGKHALVIYFYPKDESMVCTKEACAFRDAFDSYKKEGALVIGINGGTVKSHKDFAKHYKLPFVLLSDPDNKVLNMFGVKGFLGMTGRTTYVVDLQGKIIYTYDSMMHGVAHSDNALGALKGIKK